MTHRGPPHVVPVRTIVSEPNPLVVSALKTLFANDDRFHLVATIPTGTQLLKAIGNDEADLAVIAWRLADCGATDILQELKRRNSRVRVIVFSNDSDLNLVRRAVRLGVHGYCYQFDEPAILFETLHAVSRGRMCIPDIDVTRLSDTPLAQLTVRERELLGMLSRGWTNQQISHRTGITENTVKYHLKNLYDKLEVRNRAMAVAVYSREKEIVSQTFLFPGDAKSVSVVR